MLWPSKSSNLAKSDYKHRLVICISQRQRRRYSSTKAVEGGGVGVYSATEWTMMMICFHSLGYRYALGQKTGVQKLHRVLSPEGRIKFVAFVNVR